MKEAGAFLLVGRVIAGRRGRPRLAHFDAPPEAARLRFVPLQRVRDPKAADIVLKLLPVHPESPSIFRAARMGDESGAGRRLRWVRSLPVVGAALVLLGAVGLFAMRPSPSQEDVRRGLSPLAAVPLDQLSTQKHVDIQVAVPADPQWMRLVSEWGYHGVLLVPVSAERPGGQTYNAADLGLSMDVRRNGAPVRCQSEDQPPYGYSALSYGNGLRCDANPGDVLAINARAEPGRVARTGNLAAFAHWDKTRVIDTTEGLAIVGSLRWFLGALTVLGGGLLAAGVWLRQRPPGRRTG